MEGIQHTETSIFQQLNYIVMTMSAFFVYFAESLAVGQKKLHIDGGNSGLLIVLSSPDMFYFRIFIP